MIAVNHACRHCRHCRHCRRLVRAAGVRRRAGPGKSGSIQGVKASPVDKVHTWPHLLAVEFVAALAPASLQRLHELDPQGANRVVERVLRAFDTSLQRLLPQAEQGLRDGDHPAVRHVAHTLKSSSASVGALELSRRCADIENRVRTQQHDGLAERVAALQAEGQRVLEAVRGLLSE